MNLLEFIRDIPDFPEKGIVFKDITPLLGNSDALKAAQQGLLALLDGQQIDKVVGMESRGFFLGPALAMELGAGFVYASNYFQTYRYPFKDIEKITERDLGLFRLNKIHLKAPGKFGNRITYILDEAMLKDFFEKNHVHKHFMRAI